MPHFLQQYDPPLTVYNQPNNTFVADFVGNPAINFIDAKGEQHKDEFELTVFGDKKIIFTPNEKLNIAINKRRNLLCMSMMMQY